MSQFSSSNNYSATSHTNGAPSSSYAYHHHPSAPSLPSSSGAPSNLPAPHKSSSSYSSHRSTSSSHNNADSYRYHPYSRGETSHNTAGSTHYGATQQSSSYGQAPSSSYNYGNSSSRYSQSSSNLSRYGSSRSNGGGGSSSFGGSKPHRSRSAMNLHMSKKGKAPRNEYGIPFGQPGASLTAPDWSAIKQTLPLFQKNFYRESRAIAEQTESGVAEWRKSKDIVVIGAAVPRPIRSFGEAGFPPYIMAEIERAGFVEPTAIQSQGWPMAMSGRDVIGIAETGSGKTLAFLLPCIVHINAQPLLRPGDGPIVLVIAPTRELAMQIENEVSKFAYSSKIKHCCVYGGVSRRDQVRNLRNGVEIVICTPGRLLDFLECGTTNLRRVTYLVIDEADRLLDMGFEPQLSSILSQVRPDRQILMWSATWPKEVRELSKKYLLSNDVIQVSIGSALSNIKANHNVKQMIECMDNNYEKQEQLYKLLSSAPDKDNKQQLYLIFASTKKQCDYLYKQLRNDGFAVCVIHGDKQQYERDEALNSFKSGRNSIMIATDVASRGIHVNNIYMVVNYDFPQNIEDYVHRIGRTGRCGKKGLAVSFFTKSDAKRASKLINILKEANQEIPSKLLQFQQYGFSVASGGSSYHRQRYNNYSR